MSAVVRMRMPGLADATGADATAEARVLTICERVTRPRRMALSLVEGMASSAL
jgi:hypothetical protein